MAIVDILRKALLLDPRGAGDARLSALRQLGTVNRDADDLIKRVKEQQLASLQQDQRLQSSDKVAQLLSEMNAKANPSFVGPRDSELGLPPDPNQEALPEVDLEGLGVGPGDASMVRSVGDTRRAKRYRDEEEGRLKARDDSEWRKSQVESNRALVGYRGSAEDRNDRYVPGGGGSGRAPYVRQSSEHFITEPDGTVIYGTKSVMSDNTVIFTPNPKGSRPMTGVDATQKDRDAPHRVP